MKTKTPLSPLLHNTSLALNISPSPRCWRNVLIMHANLSLAIVLKVRLLRISGLTWRKVTLENCANSSSPNLPFHRLPEQLLQQQPLLLFRPLQSNERPLKACYQKSKSNKRLPVIKSLGNIRIKLPLQMEDTLLAPLTRQ